MKKFDYFCIVYSVALLVFGFNDDVPNQKKAARAIDTTSKANQSITVVHSDQTLRHQQYASMVRVPQQTPAQMRTLVATK